MTSFLCSVRHFRGVQQGGLPHRQIVNYFLTGKNHAKLSRNKQFKGYSKPQVCAFEDEVLNTTILSTTRFNYWLKTFTADHWPVTHSLNLFVRYLRHFLMRSFLVASCWGLSKKIKSKVSFENSVSFNIACNYFKLLFRQKIFILHISQRIERLE